jgi:ABC-type Zn2+ transport system substrate-binding protein/surface adhesin
MTLFPPLHAAWACYALRGGTLKEGLMKDDGEDPFSSIDPSRRSFIKKMVAVAFVAPVISSFPLSALASAQTQRSPSQHLPNGDRDDHDDHDEHHEDHDDDDRHDHD